MFRSSGPASLTPIEAHDRYVKGEIILVDVREAGEWAQMHISGAVSAPLSTLLHRIEQLPRDKPVAFYCLSGLRSARAVELAKKLGLPFDTHVAGGISAWRAAGLPVER